jgi:hypothetical protein
LCTLCTQFLRLVYPMYPVPLSCVPYVPSFYVLCTLCTQFLRLVYPMYPVSTSCVPYVPSSSVLCTLCTQFLRLVYPMYPVSLDCPFLIALSVFSNVYFLFNSFICFPDVDECEKYGKKICHHGNCVNTAGSFHCHCNSGYRFHKPSKQCIGHYLLLFCNLFIQNIKLSKARLVANTAIHSEYIYLSEI